MPYGGHPGRNHAAPAQAPQRWLAGSAAALTLLLHAVVLIALVRGFEVSPSLEFKRLAPVQVNLLRAEAVMVPPPASAVLVRPPAPRPRAPSRLPLAAETAEPPAPTRETGADPSGTDLASAQAMTDDARDIAPQPGAQAPDLPDEGNRPAEPSTDPARVAHAASTTELAPAPAGAQLPLYGVALGAPLPGRSRFQVYYGDYTDNHQVALMEYTVETDGERYELRSEGRAQGLTALFYSGVLSQRSSGRMGVNGLMPERFTEQRGKRPERSTVIDYPAAQARFSGGQQAPWQAGTQDRLSMLMQLSLIARAEPQRLAPGQVLSIPELSSRSIEPARFRSLGDEVLQTSDGAWRTVRLTRQDGNPSRDPVVDIWLGYDHGFMPVRIRLTDVGGRVLDQLLVR